MFLVNDKEHEIQGDKLIALEGKEAQAPSGKTLQITQMTVNIAILRVGSKQVTQSVFKQLPEKEYAKYMAGNIAEQEPWGIVRYDFGKYSGGVHVVFAEEGKMFRCFVRNEASFAFIAFAQEALRNYY